jgi:DNA repair photolyase
MARQTGLDLFTTSGASKKDPVASGAARGIVVHDVEARTALQPSGLLGLDYALNPYKGCEHACVYCYAPFILKETRPWGTFVDVRRNIPQVLAKELREKQKGVIGIGTVTDPYQPVEVDAKLTRMCLEVILRKDWPVVVQTKSALVTRDIDLLSNFTKAEVGMTVTAMDDRSRKLYEPLTSPVKAQFKALKKLGEAGIKTWVYVGPIIPFVTEKGLQRLVDEVKNASVRTVMVDGLRARGDSWESVERALAGLSPGVLGDIQNIRKELNGRVYFRKVAANLEGLCRAAGIECKVFVDNDKV